MGKIKLLVKYCLGKEKNEYNIKGIYQNNKIKFKDFDNIMIIDLNLDTLERISNIQEIKFNFIKKLCFIKRDNYSFDFEFELIKLEKNDKCFYVKYKISDEIYEFKLDWEDL